MMPRPMGHQLTATQPMEVVATDFVKIGRSRHGIFLYILLILCQLTRLCLMVPTKDCTALTAAKIFHERWLAIFPDPAFLITDGGTHFRCRLFRELERLRGFKHHIVAPYCQWGNGGAERLGRLLVKAFRAILADRQADRCDWPDYAAAVNEAANKVMQVSSRGNKTPVELLTGIVPLTAAQRITSLGIKGKTTTVEVVPAAVLQQALASLHSRMEGLWAEALVSQRKRREANARARAAKRIRPNTIPRINVGDMVLVARTVQPHKLAMVWTGPHQVVNAVSKFVFETEPMLAVKGRQRREIVHIVRIRRFSNGLLGTPADAKAIEQSALHDYPDNVVQRITGHSTGDDGIFRLTVRWLGYDAIHDSPEPVTSLVEDVPNLVQEYLAAHRDDPACARILRTYFPE